MSPNGGGEPEGELLAAINRDFGSFDQFKAKMSAATVAVQGSGWGWLGFNKEANRLQIATCANQDPLQVCKMGCIISMVISSEFRMG